MARMSAQQRKNLPSSAFVFSKTREFPIPDEKHAKAALIVAGRRGPDVQKKVRAAVKRKFPNLVSGS